MSAAQPVLLDALEAHLLELDLLWELRGANIFSLRWTLDDLRAIEARADAHLDGLLIGGSEGLRLARAALATPEPGAAAAGAHVLLAAGDAQTVLAALEGAEPAIAAALCATLRLGQPGASEPELRALAERAEGAVAAAACDVLVFCGAKLPRPLEPLAGSADPVAQELAFAALGRLEQPLAESALRAGLASEEPAVRTAALRAAARGGTPRLADACRAAIAAREPAAAEALELLGWIADPDDLALLGEALADPALGPAAARALGHTGRPEAVPRLLEALDRAELAPPASAAFAALTGAEDLLVRDLADPERARSHWQRVARRLAPGGRYFHAAPLPASTGAAFHALPLGRRLGVYLGARARRDAFPRLELEQRAALQDR